MNTESDEIFMTFEEFMRVCNRQEGTLTKLNRLVESLSGEKSNNLKKQNTKWLKTMIKTLSDNGIQVIDRMKNLDDFLVVFSLEDETASLENAVGPFKISVSTKDEIVSLECYFPRGVEREKIVDTLLTLSKLHKRSEISPVALDLLTGKILMKYEYLNDYGMVNFLKYLSQMIETSQNAYRRIFEEIPKYEQEYHDKLIGMRE